MALAVATMALLSASVSAISVPQGHPLLAARGVPSHVTNQMTCFASSFSTSAFGSQQYKHGAKTNACHQSARLRRTAPTPRLRMQQNPESNPTVVSRFPGPEEEQGFRGSKEVSVLLASVVLGIVTGAGVVTFKNGITAMREFTFAGPYASWLNDVAKNAVAGGLNRADINIQYAFLPLVGGVCTAIILKLLGQKDFGVPLPGQLEEVDKGIAPNVKVLFARQLAAISALGSGASLGPEGPSVEIGVSLSRVLSNALGYGHELRRVLVSAGAAAGVSAGFDAPLSGVMFALELIQPSAAPDRSDKDSAVAFRATAGAILTASAISCVIARYLIIGEDKFMVNGYQLVDPLVEIPIYMSLGVLSGVVATGFRLTVANLRKVYSGQKEGFEFMKNVPDELKPMIATGICGFVAVKYPETMFFGYNAVNSLLSEKAVYKDSIPDLLGLMSLKIGLTSSCMASGLMGGNFAPALFFGAALGAAYQEVLTHLPIGEIASTSNYAMIGAAAMLGAVFRAPITAILLLFELTRDYDIVLPLISSVGFGTVTIDLLEGEQTTPTWAWWWQPNPISPALAPLESELRASVVSMVKKGGGDPADAVDIMDSVETKGSVRAKQVLNLAQDIGLRAVAEEALGGLADDEVDMTSEEAKSLMKTMELNSIQAKSVLQSMVDRQAEAAVPANVE